MSVLTEWTARAARFVDEVLRAIYLTRRYGVTDRRDVAYPLGELAHLVERNHTSGAEAHARRLVGRL